MKSDLTRRQRRTLTAAFAAFKTEAAAMCKSRQSEIRYKIGKLQITAKNKMAEVHIKSLVCTKSAEQPYNLPKSKNAPLILRVYIHSENLDNNSLINPSKTNLQNFRKWRETEIICPKQFKNNANDQQYNTIVPYLRIKTEGSMVANKQ